MSLSQLPTDIRLELLEQMDYEELLNFCRLQKEWYTICRHPRIRDLIERKYQEKLNRGMTEDDLFLWKVIDDVKNMNYYEQAKYINQYSFEQIERLYNTFKKWYFRLYELLNVEEYDSDYYSDDSSLYQPPVFSQLPDNAYRDSILSLMALGKRQVVKFLENPTVIPQKKEKGTSLIQVLYDHIDDYYYY